MTLPKESDVTAQANLWHGESQESDLLLTDCPDDPVQGAWGSADLVGREPIGIDRWRYDPASFVGSRTLATTHHGNFEGSIQDDVPLLRQRLDNANNHFRRKAAEVLGDEDAVSLLSALYQNASMQISELNVCKLDIPLARLSAADFCEISTNLIYITESGKDFIESVARGR